MSWFSFLVALVKLVASISEWALRQKHINEGQALFIADTLIAQAKAISRAHDARLEQRRRDYDGAMFEEPDKYRRD